MMRVNKLLETCVYVDDVNAAERFYCDVLGLTIQSRQDKHHSYLRCGSDMVLLMNPENTSKEQEPGALQAPPHGARGSIHIAFSIEQSEIPAWREHLTKLGVKIEREHAWVEGGYAIYFRDPCGNCVELGTPETWQPGPA
jgi:catechol-2,3-dioxygenase